MTIPGKNWRFLAFSAGLFLLVVLVFLQFSRFSFTGRAVTTSLEISGSSILPLSSASNGFTTDSLSSVDGNYGRLNVSPSQASDLSLSWNLQALPQNASPVSAILRFYWSGSEIISSTPSLTPTPSPTASETPTPSETITPSPNTTATPSETPSPTPSESPTPTSEANASSSIPSPTETSTPSPSVSPTPASTETPTPTPTETPTPSATPSPTSEANFSANSPLLLFDSSEIATASVYIFDGAEYVPVSSCSSLPILSSPSYSDCELSSVPSSSSLTAKVVFSSFASAIVSIDFVSLNVSYSEAVASATPSPSETAIPSANATETPSPSPTANATVSPSPSVIPFNESQTIGELTNRFKSKGEKIEFKKITKKEKKSKGKGIGAQEIVSDEYDASLGFVDSNNVSASVDITGIADISAITEVQTTKIENEVSVSSGERVTFSTDAFTLNSLPISSATLTLPKYSDSDVNAILSCSDSNWDFNSKSCSSWDKTAFSFQQNDSYVWFSVDHFTTYAGGNATFNQSVSAWNGTLANLNLSGQNLTLLRTVNWTNVTSQLSISPNSRLSHSTVFNSNNKTVVLFGGGRPANVAGDTWFYNFSNSSWKNMSPLITNAPSNRYGAAMTYDAANDILVLFGGFAAVNLGDTWILNFSNMTWVNVSPSLSVQPPIRSEPSAVFDSDNNVSILFGGQGNVNAACGPSGITFCNDIWSFNYTSRTWTNKTPSVLPYARYGSMASYDAANKSVIIFGGYNSSSVYNNQTWAYNLTDNAWTQRFPASAPPVRYGGGMAYDLNDSASILFGGYSDSAFADTWMYNSSSNAWSNITSGNSPSARYGPAAFDYPNRVFVLFGGTNGPSYFADTWIYSLNGSSSNYFLNGTYNSTSFYANQSSIVMWDKLLFNATVPLGANLTFQVSTSLDNSTWSAFAGPNGLSNTYYDASGQSINASNTTYIRYKAFFSTNNSFFTPVLSNVSITYFFLSLSNNTRLKIWDSSEGNGTGGASFTRFYANYTGFPILTPLSGASYNCNFTQNSSGTWSTPPVPMWFNATSGSYETNATINATTGVFFNASCYDSSGTYANLSAMDEIGPFGCGTITASIKLTQNVSSAGTCFTIGADDIAIDLNGYSINYSQSTLGYGIYANGRNRVSIGNGTIWQGDPAIADAHAVYLQNGTNMSSVYNMTIFAGKGSGISVNVSSVNNTIRNNTLIAPSAATGYKGGISLLWKSDNNSVASNNVTAGSNVIPAIELSSDYASGGASNNLLYNNFVNMTSSSIGIHIYAGAARNRIFNNTVYVTGSTFSSGIAIQYFSSNNDVFNNTIYGNPYRGINIFSSNPRDNRVYGNNITMSTVSANPLLPVIGTAGTNNSFWNNIINFSQTNGVGLYLNGESSGVFTNNTINAKQYGIFLSGASSNNFTNNTIMTCSVGCSPTYSDIFSNETSHNNTFLNNSFSRNKLGWGEIGTNNFTIQWYLDIFVQSSSGAESGVSVNVTNATSALPEISSQTDSNGWLGTRVITELIGNNTVNTTYTPHGIYAYKENLGASSNYNASLVMNKSQLLNITITPGCATHSGSFTLISNITSTGNCITIGAPNIVIDCNGYNITGQGTANSVGINNTGFKNVTVMNCTIANYSTGVLYSSSADNGLITNSTIRNISNFGIYADSSANDTISNNTIMQYGSASAGGWSAIGLYSGGAHAVSSNDIHNAQGLSFALTIGVNSVPSTNNTVSNNLMNNSGSGYAAVFVTAGSTGNAFYSNNLTVTYLGAFYFRANITVANSSIYTPVAPLPAFLFDLSNPTVLNVSVINTTFNKSGVYSSFGSYHILKVQQYLYVSVRNTTGQPVSGAAINVSNSSSSYSWNASNTTSDGTISPVILTEYIQNGTSPLFPANQSCIGLNNANVTCYAPYIVTAWQYINGAYYSDSKNTTLNESANLSFTLAPGCGTYYGSAVFERHINSTGNCITIGAPNIVIDCNGYNITGKGIANSIGVTNIGFKNVTVKNCSISNYSIGINFTSSADNGFILNNSVHNVSVAGVKLKNSVNITFSNNSIFDYTNASSSGPNGLDISGGGAHKISYNRFNPPMNGAYSIDLGGGGDYVASKNNTVAFNIINHFPGNMGIAVRPAISVPLGATGNNLSSNNITFTSQAFQIGSNTTISNSSVNLSSYTLGVQSAVIYFVGTSQVNVSIINTTFNKSLIWNPDYNGNTTVQQYLYVNIRNTTGQPVSGVAINVSNATSSYSWNVSNTTSDGTSSPVILTEYLQNGTSPLFPANQSCIGLNNANVTCYAPYTITAWQNIGNVRYMTSNTTILNESSNVSITLEREVANLTLFGPNLTLSGVSGSRYTFNVSILLNNSIDATLRNFNISLDSAPPNLAAVSAAMVFSNCTATQPRNSSCVSIFNVSVPTDEGNYRLYWRANWTENNGTVTNYTGYFTTFNIPSNPQLSINLTSISMSSNISQGVVLNVQVSASGNKNVQLVGPTVVPNATSGINTSWVGFSGTSALWTLWHSDTNKFDEIGLDFPESLNINITPSAPFLRGNYSGIINISGVSGGISVSQIINVSMTIDPEMNLSSYNFTANASANLSSNFTLNITVNATGNAPLTNVTVSLDNGTIPAGWLNFTSNSTAWDPATNAWSVVFEGTRAFFGIVISIGDFIAGIFSSLIKITTAEGITQYFNLTIVVNPQLTTVNSLTIVASHGNTSQNSFLLNSSGNVKLINVSVSYYNASLSTSLPSSWITVNPTSVAEILENSRQNVSISVVVPKFQNPGNYTASVNISGYNFPNNTIEINASVPATAPWSFKPAFNQSRIFNLNQEGPIGTILLNNSGNIPVNFSISYADVAGYTSCLSFECLLGAVCSGFPNVNNETMLLPKNSTANLTVCQKGPSTAYSNVGVAVTISNGSATPATNSTYLFFNISDSYPIVFFNGTKVSSVVQSYVELNKSILLDAVIGDDQKNPGLDSTFSVFNVTAPGSLMFNYSGPQSAAQSTVGCGCLNKTEFTLLFNATVASGTYNVTYSIRDAGGKETMANFSFDVVPTTALQVSGGAVSVSGVNRTANSTASLPVFVNNTGRAGAYFVNISGEFFVNASSANTFGWNYSIPVLFNVSANSSTTIYLNITVPSSSLGAYFFQPSANWTDANTSTGNSTGANGTITALSNPDFQLVPLSQVFAIEHGIKTSTSFVIAPSGNDNVSTFIIQSQSVSPNLTVAYNFSTGSVNFDSNVSVGTNLSVAFGSSSATSGSPRQFTTRVYTSYFSKTFVTNVTTPINRTWFVNRANLTINGVANQNDVNNETIINHTGTYEESAPLTFSLNISGNITQVANLLSDTASIHALNIYGIPINYSAGENNNKYTGVLNVTETSGSGISALVNLSFNSYFYNLRVLNISAPPSILAGDRINATIEIAYGETFITDNTTYSMLVDNSISCPLVSNLTVGNRTTLNCTAPSATDAVYHNLTIRANYSSDTGSVLMTRTNNSALHYRDLTPPRVEIPSAATIIKGTNTTITVNVTDNNQTSNVTAQISATDYPAANYSMLYNASTLLYQLSRNITTTGLFTVRFFANDTTGNMNSSTTTTFEVYENRTYTGTLLDLQSNPITANFTVISTSSNETTSFSTNASGFYNQTLKTKIYDLKASFLYFNVTINSVNFFDLNPSFIQIDRLTSGDISGQLVGAFTGFAANSTLPNTASITANFSSFLSSITTKDNLRIYQCAQPYYNYTTRTCATNWWIQLPVSVDKVNNVLTATFSGYFANGSAGYVLAELPPSTAPQMQLPNTSFAQTINHSSTSQLQVEVWSIGQTNLANVYANCTSGALCSSFGTFSQIVSSIPSGAKANLTINITVPAGTSPSNYSGTFAVRADSGIAQDISATITVPTDASWNHTLTSSNISVGSSANDTFGNLTLRNTGNVPLAFSLNSSSSLSLLPSAANVSAQNNATITVNYSAPVEIGYYSQAVSVFTNASLNGTIPLALNVTHEANITGISQTTELSAGNTITVTANARYLYSPVSTNFSVMIDNSSCTSFSQDNGTLTCTLPAIGTHSVHSLSVYATFQNKTAYSYKPLYYADIFLPETLNFTSEAQRGNTTAINFTVFDDNGIQSVSATLTKPSGGTIVPSVSFSNTSLSAIANLTELGDYSVSYTLTDYLGNSGTSSKTVEIYEPFNSTGTIANSSGGGVPANLYFYKPSNSSLVMQRAINDTGAYVLPIRKRNYDLNVTTLNASLFIRNTNLTGKQNFLQMESVPKYQVGISNVRTLYVAAINTSLNSSSVTLTLPYDLSLVTNINNLYAYKCMNWAFTSQSCSDATWETITSVDRSKVSQLSFNSSSFSAYLVGETVAQIAPNTYITNVAGGGGGGSSSSSTSGPSLNEIVKGVQDAVSSMFSGLTNTTNFLAGQSIDIRQAVRSLSKDEAKLGLQSDVPGVDRDLFAGEMTETSLHFKNLLNDTATISVKAMGEIKDFVLFQQSTITLLKGEEGDLFMKIVVPSDAQPGVYSGYVAVSNQMGGMSVPVSVRVLQAKEKLLDLKIQPISDTVEPGGIAKIETNVYNLGESKRVDVQLVLQLIESSNETLVAQSEEALAVETTVSKIFSLRVPENTPEGKYIVRATAKYSLGSGDSRTREASSIAYLRVQKNIFGMLANTRILGVLPAWQLFILLIAGGGVLSAYYYRAKEEAKKKRYLERVDFTRLPSAGARSGFIGKIAETDIRSFFPIDKLTTHTLIAGATGSGKTVAAQVLVEEALRKNVAVIVFDPTAQWTGFLRQQKNKDMLSSYSRFGMREDDARPFPGNIHIVQDPKQHVDIKKFMKPGEITVFCMNRLDIKQHEQFVANTIKLVFASNFEEYQQLRLVLVYDEVHRLLPKFGGTGEGFVAIERGAREFRKWGIGMVLVSQVLSDFIGEIKANIGTEIQLRTKYEGDLERMKLKYGEETMKSIVRASVGSGMLQNSEFNNGAPYFVSFRPLMHNIVRLTDAELDKYSEYNARIEQISSDVDDLKAMNIDVLDLELELNLARDKMKKGAFNIADIYLESLSQKVGTMVSKYHPLKREKPAMIAPPEESFQPPVPVSKPPAYQPSAEIKYAEPKPAETRAAEPKTEIQKEQFGTEPLRGQPKSESLREQPGTEAKKQEELKPEEKKEDLKKEEPKKDDKKKDSSEPEKKEKDYIF